MFLWQRSLLYEQGMHPAEIIALELQKTRVSQKVAGGTWGSVLLRVRAACTRTQLEIP